MMESTVDDKLSARDIREFNAYLAGCTDSQVLGVYDKEKAAGRTAYAELAAQACRNRGIYYGEAGDVAN